MQPKYIKFVGPFIIVVVVVMAAYISWSSLRTGLEFDSKSSGSISGDPHMELPADTQSLKTLYRTINKVQKRYIDATRIDSRTMFVAAMRAIQSQVSKVLVQERGDELAIRVENKEKVLRLNDISTPWVLLQRVKEVFGFLATTLKDDEVDYREIEYAMINEMLQTLDPHSVFLDPSQFRDMRDKTQGKFGGLGVVISIRDGFLTVISPLDGTPAHRAGLQSGDQIVKIDDVSTINMPLEDAVGLLRGDPGTMVTVHILRKNWEEPLPIKIERAEVKVESTESHLLSGKVGYVQIRDFQSNTFDDLKDHLGGFRRSGIKGLVIDLRGCPGGLLESAIEVADHFLKDGVVVTTAGQGPADRDVRRATNSGDEPDYPVVVLVNRGSASASEIVAGALKNRGRAMLVGERTFGKGSVQVLYDFQDGSALKLTTAQYLTPGDESIQSIGVIPHIELLPMRADEKTIDLLVGVGYRESDLSHHFVTTDSGQAKGPKLRLNYLQVPRTRPNPENQPEAIKAIESTAFEPDFEINLARDLVLKMVSREITDFDSEALASVTEERASAEDRKLVAALDKLNIDWTSSEKEEPAQVAIDAKLPSQDPLKAGDESEITVSVSNQGPGTLYRLLAVSKSDFRPLDDRELAFGKIGPGETISRTLKFKIPKDTLDRTDDVLWSFNAAGKQPFDSVVVRTEVKALPRPRFAYVYQIMDTTSGNGDSRLQPGETVDFIVDMENVGQGPSLETYITLAGLSGSKLSIIKGRDSLKEVPPGERRRTILSFEVKPGFNAAYAEVQLALADVDLKVYSLQKIQIPIEKSLTVKTEDITATVTSGGKTPVYSGPNIKNNVVATFQNGSLIEIDASTDIFYRVRVDDDRIGWIPKTVVSNQATGTDIPAELALVSSPDLTIDKLESVVRSDTVKLKGTASDESAVRDIYIFVGNDKVFFKPNGGPEGSSKLSFETDVPLKNGLNYISIVAEESANLFTREIIAIRRDREDGVSFLMPRSFDGEPRPITASPK